MAKKTPLLREAKQLVEEQVDEIDEKVEYLNKRLALYDRVKEQRDMLLAARRALLGGSRLTGSGGTKVRQEDLVNYIKEKDRGVSPSEVAEHFGVSQPTISSHFYRGKNERFLSKDNLWYLRDPKSGINTADDIEED